MRNLENILWGTPGTDGQLFSIDELDVDRKATLVNKLASEPLVEDAWDWMTFTAKLHGQDTAPALV